MSWMPIKTLSLPRPFCARAATRPQLLGVAIALLILALSAGASASTVLKLDMQSLVANSEQIIDGEVIKVESKVENGKVYTYTTVRVDEGLKGAKDGETVTIKQIGGRTENLATRVAGVPSFKDGEHVVVFLEKLKENTPPVVTGMSQGKFHIAVGPDNLTQYAVPFLGDLNLLEPVRVQPAPGTPQEAAQNGTPDSATQPGQTRVTGQPLEQRAQGDSADAQPDGADSADGDRANFHTAQPAQLYRRVVPLKDFKQQIRQVIQEQQPE